MNIETGGENKGLRTAPSRRLTERGFNDIDRGHRRIIMHWIQAEQDLGGRGFSGRPYQSRSLRYRRVVLGACVLWWL
jgi:hypothetical protein